MNINDFILIIKYFIQKQIFANFQLFVYIKKRINIYPYHENQLCLFYKLF